MIIRMFMAFFTNPILALWLLGSLSVAALAAALISQYGFDMHPCFLCLWQRIPYAVVILLAILGIIAGKIMGNRYACFNIFLCGIALIINSFIAFYHVGVEQHWWSSGCSVPNFSGLTPEEIMIAIKNAPAVSCDQIPFELFGISMAGYNVIFCLGLGLYALITTKIISKKN